MVLSAEPASISVNNPIRVMLVDDSAVIRGFLRRFIETDPEIKVTKTYSNGQMAVNAFEPDDVDVVVLDIEMPVMDGLTALPHILNIDPNVQVIIASTLTKENANITLKAFKIGAAECLAKPTSSELAGSTAFQDNLVHKVKALGTLARRKRAGLSPSRQSAASLSAYKSSVGATEAAPKPIIEKKFSLRMEVIKRPRAIAIGSSTGGPQALIAFFAELKDLNIRQPIFITQHMPATFTTILAEHITKQSGFDCREGVDGEVIKDGRIYLAPGDYHMTIKVKDGNKIISLNQEAQESFCRPAVDPMLRSLIEVYGGDILAFIFTGMGSDGLKSCQQLVEKGGIVLAQDEATSVVWGMPGAVAMNGICTKVLPLGLMSKELKRYVDFGGLR